MSTGETLEIPKKPRDNLQEGKGGRERMSVVVSFLNIVNASCQSKLVTGSGWLVILWSAWHFSFTTRLSGLIYFDIFLPRRKLTKKEGGN